MQGAFTTCTVLLCSSVISMVVGIVWGVVRCDCLRIPYISFMFDCITFLLRAVPFYVQLLIVYFVLPGLVGIYISPFSAAVVSLGFCSAAYVSQMVRGGINGINKGQWEAAQMLGYSKMQTLQYIIVPQVVRIILPALLGECDQLLKSTAIISAIGVLELTGAARNIIAQELNPLTMYTVIAVMYVCMSSIMAIFAGLVERRYQL